MHALGCFLLFLHVFIPKRAFPYFISKSPSRGQRNKASYKQRPSDFHVTQREWLQNGKGMCPTHHESLPVGSLNIYNIYLISVDMYF